MAADQLGYDIIIRSCKTCPHRLASCDRATRQTRPEPGWKLATWALLVLYAMAAVGLALSLGAK